MGLFMEVSELHIDVKGNMEKIRSNALWTFAATEWHRLYAPYVPYREGILTNTVRITPGQIEHTVPYAHYQYEGNFNFRRDQHPLACGHWDKAAEPTQKPKLIDAIQRYIDSGRCNLSG